MKGFLSRCPLCLKLLTNPQRLEHHNFCPAIRHQAHVIEYLCFMDAQARDAIIHEQLEMAAEYRSCGEC